NIFIGTSNEFGALESGLTAALFGPVISVVGGGIGTILVVLGVAKWWPETLKIGRLDKTLRQEHRLVVCAPSQGVIWNVFSVAVICPHLINASLQRGPGPSLLRQPL